MIENIKKWNTQISNDIEDFKQEMKDIEKVAKGIWKVYEFTYNNSIGIYVNKKLEEHYKLQQQEIQDRREKLNKFMYHRLNETIYMQRQLLDKNAERPNFKLEQSQDAYRELKDNQKILNKLHKNPYRTNSLEKYMDDNYMSYLKNEKTLKKAGQFQKNKFKKDLKNDELDLQIQHQKQKLIRDYTNKNRNQTKHLDEAVKSPATLLMTGGLSMFYAMMQDIEVKYHNFKDLSAELKEIQDRKDLKDNQVADKLFNILDSKLSKEIKDLYKTGDEKTFDKVKKMNPNEVIKGEVIKDKNLPEKTNKQENKIKGIAALTTAVVVIRNYQDINRPKYIDIEKLDNFKRLENQSKKLDKFINTDLLENKNKHKVISYKPNMNDKKEEKEQIQRQSKRMKR